MSKLQSFFKENAGQLNEQELKLLRFEEPLIIKPVTAGEEQKINAASFSMKPGKDGKQEPRFDTGRYNALVAIASIEFPDLNDTNLQDSYGVRGAEALYGVMFTMGEHQKIQEMAMEISGLNESTEDLKEEAKN
mgnify:CR=1 FL=1